MTNIEMMGFNNNAELLRALKEYVASPTFHFPLSDFLSEQLKANAKADAREAITKRVIDIEMMDDKDGTQTKAIEELLAVNVFTSGSSANWYEHWVWLALGNWFRDWNNTRKCRSHGYEASL